MKNNRIRLFSILIFISLLFVQVNPLLAVAMDKVEPEITEVASSDIISPTITNEVSAPSEGQQGGETGETAPSATMAPEPTEAQPDGGTIKPAPSGDLSVPGEEQLGNETVEPVPSESVVPEPENETADNALENAPAPANTSEIYGNFEIEYLSNGNISIKKYLGTGGHVAIPDSINGIKVTEIGATAFLEAGLTSVDLPSGIEKIGAAAFRNNQGLTTIYFPKTLSYTAPSGWGGPFVGCGIVTPVFEEGITKIPSYVFDRCTSIVSVVIPASVVEIEYAAFNQCTSLSDVSLPSGLTKISTSAFYGCTSLTEITIPKSLSITVGTTTGGPFAGSGLSYVLFEAGITKIADDLFNNCTNIIEIVLPDSITEIGSNAFKQCSKLEDINLPTELRRIGVGSFENCSSLKKIHISAKLDSCTTTTRGPFYGAPLETITFEEGIEKIADNLFRSSNINTIDIPDTVKEIGAAAFSNCKKLEKVVFPNALQTIETSAFEGCTSLKKISIYSQSLNDIGLYSFRNCSSLSAAYFYCNAPSYFYASNVFNKAAPGFAIYYLEDRTGWQTPLWKGYSCFPMKLGEELPLPRIGYVIQIVDSKTDRPISSVIINYGSQDYKTDENGCYYTSNKVPNLKNVTFSKKGYVTKKINSLNLYPNQKNIVKLEKNFGDMDSIGDISFGNNGISDTIHGPNLDLFGSNLPLFELPLDMQFNIPGSQIKYNVDEESRTCRYAFGDINLNTSGWDKDYNSYKNLIKGSGNAGGLEALSNKFWSGAKTNAKLGLDFDKQVYGYMEFDVSGDNQKFKEGALVIVLKADTSVKMPTGVPFLYLKFGIEGKTTGKMALVLKEAGVIESGVDANGSLHLEISPYLGILADVFIASVEGGIKGAIDMGIDFPVDTFDKSFVAVLSGSLYLKYEALFIFSGGVSWKFLDTQIYPNNSSQDTANILLSKDNLNLIPRTNSNIYARTNNISPQVIRQGVIPTTKMQLRQLDDGRQILVWVDDLSTRSTMNRTALFYSIYEDGQWTSPQMVQNDGTADFDFDMVADGNNVYIIWQNAKIIFKDESTISDIAENIDVYYAEFANGQFTHAINLTSENNFDYETALRLAVDGNQKAAIWVVNSENDVLGREGHNSIICTNINSEGVGQAETLSQDLGVIYDLDAIYDNETLKTVYVTSADSNSEYNGTEVYLNDGSNTMRITNNNVPDINAQFVQTNTEIKLFWQSDHILSVMGSNGQVQQTDLTIPAGARDVAVLSNGTGDLALACTVNEGYRSELYGAFYEENRWSDISKLTDTGKYISRFDGYLDNNSEIIGVGSTADVSNNEQDPYSNFSLSLLSARETNDFDLRGDAFILDNETGFDIKVNANNVGTKKIDQYEVKILDSSGALIKATNVIPDTPINSGEDFVPSIAIDYPIRQGTFAVTIAGVTKTVEFDFRVVDLEIVDTNYSIVNDNVAINISIANHSDDIPYNASIALKSDDEHGDNIANQDIVLQQGKTDNFIFNIPYADFSFQNDSINYVFAEIESSARLLDYSKTTALIEIEKKQPDQILLGNHDLTMTEGESVALTATLNPEGADLADTIWFSSDEDVAEYLDGKVIAKHYGYANITVMTSGGNVKDTCKVTVLPSGADPDTVYLMSYPEKYIYSIGEAPDLTGGVIYLNGDIIDLNEQMVETFDTSRRGVREVKLIYNGKQITFDILVI